MRDERQANGVKTASGLRGGMELNMQTVDTICCRFPIVGARCLVPLYMDVICIVIQEPWHVSTCPQQYDN